MKTYILPIEVKQKHINEGRKCSCYRSPVSLAIKETLFNMIGAEIPLTVGAVSVEFLINSLMIKGNKIKVKDYLYSLPKEAQEFIEDYDLSYIAENAVKPFTFDLLLAIEE